MSVLPFRKRVPVPMQKERRLRTIDQSIARSIENILALKLQIRELEAERWLLINGHESAKSKCTNQTPPSAA
jgi:hypothetical protein